MEIILGKKSGFCYGVENAVDKAEKELKASGHTVLNPVKNKGFSYKDCIDMGLCELMKCDGIYMLDGWEESRGARLEYLYASVTGMIIVEQRREKK